MKQTFVDPSYTRRTHAHITKILDSRLHYAQLSNLFEIVGFEAFMLVMANNMLRDR